MSAWDHSNEQHKNENKFWSHLEWIIQAFYFLLIQSSVSCYSTFISRVKATTSAECWFQTITPLLYMLLKSHTHASKTSHVAESISARVVLWILRKSLISYKNVCPWSSERFSWHGSSALAWINQRTSGIVNIAQSIISNVIFTYTKFIWPLSSEEFWRTNSIDLSGCLHDPWYLTVSFLGRKTKFQLTLGYFYI